MIALAAAAALVLAAPSLVCPSGTELRGAAPPDGFEEWCEGKDAAGQPLKQGPARRFYDDGGLWIEQRFLDGEPDGAFVERHRNGKPAREGTFERGRKTGRWTVFFESGTVEEQSEWLAGSPHGRFVSHWPNGRKRSEGRHCGGVQCGTWRAWDQDGREMGSVEYGEQTLAP